VRQSINEIFLNVDKHVLLLRRFIQSTSHVTNKPNIVFQKVKKPNNQWRSLQLERAQQIFPDIDPSIKDVRVKIGFCGLLCPFLIDPPPSPGRPVLKILFLEKAKNIRNERPDVSDLPLLSV